MKILRAEALIFAMVLISCTTPAARSQTRAHRVPAPSSPQQVIIDTDIGDDIDDAFALALALKSPELKILGVTTTFGNTEMRARLLDHYLQAVSRKDIPVLAGPATRTNSTMTQAAYANSAPDKKHDDGAQFILREAREHPGQVTLIGIGPLSTVRAAIERDPAAFRKLKRVVIMGGSIYRGYGLDPHGKPNPPMPEWNILNDPTGLRDLLASGVPVFMMPLDSTQVPLETADRKTIFDHPSPLTSQLNQLYQEWTAGTPNHSPTPTLFDPVAVTYTFKPDLCPARPMHIDVDAKGMTIPGNGAPNARVCLQSDEKGFLALLMERINR